MNTLLLLGFLAATNGQRECATIEECRASVAALKHQVLKLVEQNKACANEVFQMKLGASLTLPEDLKTKLEGFEKTRLSEVPKKEN